MARTFTNDTQQYGTHWHLRIQGISNELLADLLEIFEREVANGYFTYAVGGIEKSNLNGDVELQHLHVAIGTNRSTKKWPVVNKLYLLDENSKKNYTGWYLQPVYSTSSPIKNIEYCTKSGVLFEFGNRPSDDVNVRELGAKATQARAKEKWQQMIKLAKNQEWEKLEADFPYEWISQGAKLKSLYLIQRVPDYREHGNHLWIYGTPGTGKSAYVEAFYPNHYKKRADKDWLGYNPDLEPGHRTVYLADFDQAEMKKLTPQVLKVMCDPQGFNADKKYAGGDIICPSQIIITSNFRLGECFPPGAVGAEQQKAALRRRFREVNIATLLAEKGIALRPKAELEQLKNQGNFDYMKCFVKVTISPTISPERPAKRQRALTEDIEKLIEEDLRDYDTERKQEKELLFANV